jgi:uncharacterized phiE125 gp8 family phage protein
MSAILLTAPAVEPVSLAEAKAFLRVEHNDDDDLITALTAGSRIHVETQTRRALITQSWRLALDCWPDDGRLTVIPAPLQAVTAARVYNFDGHTHTVDPQAFVPDLGASALAFAPWALPQPGRLAAGIELDVESRERELATQVLIAEQGRWYTALPRPLFAFAFVIYVWKVVVWDRVLGLGTTPALSGDVAQWAMIVLTAYFGGRSIEKVARILSRK